MQEISDESSISPSIPLGLRVPREEDVEWMRHPDRPHQVESLCRILHQSSRSTFLESLELEACYYFCDYDDLGKYFDSLLDSPSLKKLALLDFQFEERH
jgi:hypothetical protein